jgi:hypothetical protein
VFVGVNVLPQPIIKEGNWMVGNRMKLSVELPVMKHQNPVMELLNHVSMAATLKLKSSGACLPA